MSVIKNSATQQANSLTKNRLTIGTNKVNYGPTATTGFYSGIEPPAGGWVIYRATADGKLNIFCPKNNSELVYIVNRLMGDTTLSSWQSCLEWLATSSDYFVTNRSIPDINTENIVLYLDAGISESYPNTNYTWYNICDNQYDGTLTNYVGAMIETSHSLDPPFFRFLDTEFHHVTIPNIGNLNKWTIEAWFRVNTSLTNKITSIVTNEFDLVNRLNFSLGTNQAPSSYKLDFLMQMVGIIQLDLIQLWANGTKLLAHMTAPP